MPTVGIANGPVHLLCVFGETLHGAKATRTVLTSSTNLVRQNRSVRHDDKQKHAGWSRLSSDPRYPSFWAKLLEYVNWCQVELAMNFKLGVSQGGRIFQVHHPKIGSY